MATLAQADALAARADEAAGRGDVRGASMLLCHCAGVLEQLLQTATSSSDEIALRERAALCRQRAAQLQAEAAAQKALAVEAQAALDRPSPVAAVAAVGAVAALALAGPFTAMVAAAGCALATRREDGFGEAARRTGEAAADALASARAFDRTHEISKKGAVLADKASARFSEVEDRLKESNPHAAAALGIAARGAKFAVGSSRLALAATLVSQGGAAAEKAADVAHRSERAADALASVSGAVSRLGIGGPAMLDAAIEEPSMAGAVVHR